MKSLVITYPGDTTAECVARAVQARGWEPYFFDPGLLPSAAELVYESGPKGIRRILSGPSGELSLDEVGSAWYRRPRRVGTDSQATTDQYFSQLETYDYYMGLLNSLDCRWLPGPPGAVTRAELKVEQLYRAERLGFLLPRTVVSNRRREVADLYSAEEGRVISKISEPHVFQRTSGLGRATARMTRRDLAFLHRLRGSPAIFQSLEPKALEVRVTVVDRAIFAAAIYSQENGRSRVDWRIDQRRLRYETHQLPPAEEKRCLDLVAGFGLSYGAIDLILRPDGRYVFLELNPNGQYQWLEEALGLPISGAVAAFLTGEDPGTPASCEGRERSSMRGTEQ